MYTYQNLIPPHLWGAAGFSEMSHHQDFCHGGRAPAPPPPWTSEGAIILKYLRCLMYMKNPPKSASKSLSLYKYVHIEPTKHSSSVCMLQNATDKVCMRVCAPENTHNTQTHEKRPLKSVILCGVQSNAIYVVRPLHLTGPHIKHCVYLQQLNSMC